MRSSQEVLPYDEGVARIRRTDPSFDPGDFERRAGRAFFLLGRAWQDRDPELARPFMSPGAHRDWSVKVQLFIDRRRRSVLEGMRLDSLDLTGFSRADDFDRVLVRIEFTCAAYEVDEDTGRILSGDRTPGPVTELWEFRRAVGARTPDRRILDGECPNCASALRVGRLGECRSCGAAVAGGRYDWVLSGLRSEGVTPVDGGPVARP
ncbi:TIM44-like domain-containing protein [Streptomyces sp. NPDC056716]|uniref:TIM44-like domain-containing protein n=1 Tax=unclassified Streptomyces TaxID=2593676 RepID=UPI0036D0EF48